MTVRLPPYHLPNINPRYPDVMAKYAVSWLHQRLCECMAHEVSESLHVGGVRLFDPHAGERSR